MCWRNEQVGGHWISGLLKTHSLLGPRVQPVVGLVWYLGVVGTVGWYRAKLPLSRASDSYLLSLQATFGCSLITPKAMSWSHVGQLVLVMENPLSGKR